MHIMTRRTGNMRIPCQLRYNPQLSSSAPADSQATRERQRAHHSHASYDASSHLVRVVHLPLSSLWYEVLERVERELSGVGCEGWRGASWATRRSQRVGL